MSPICCLCGDGSTHEMHAPHRLVAVCDGCGDRAYHLPVAP